MHCWRAYVGVGGGGFRKAIVLCVYKVINVPEFKQSKLKWDAGIKLILCSREMENAATSLEIKRDGYGVVV